MVWADVSWIVYNRKVFGHVRQLVDSLPYKEEVRGSSPFVPTRFNNAKWKMENGKYSEFYIVRYPFSIVLAES